MIPELQVHYNPNRQAFDLYIFQKNPMTNETWYYKAPAKIEQTESFDIEPFITVPQEMVQTLMDRLYRAGIRPTEPMLEKPIIQAKDAHIAAKDEHIEDLRRIAFKLLKVN